MLLTLSMGTPNREDTRLTLHIIAQSHIDLAWWWQYDPETTHVCTKLTFGPATTNMDKFPEYHFSASQVSLYRATEEIYPDIFQKMQKYIKEGRWEIVGGMFCEAEGAQPCGESLVRQCIYGKKYWKERFGFDITTGWQEDSWSHPWQLPQIMLKSGITSYMYMRGQNNHEDTLFWWEAPDGSRILAHRPLLEMWHYPNRKWQKHLETMAKKYGINDVMIMIGKGDHGGGPKAVEVWKILQYAKWKKKKFTVKFNSFQNYMQTVMQTSKQIPVFKNEFAYELTGDLTNMGEIKLANRELENFLLSTEKWATIAFLLSPGQYKFPQEEFHQCWELLLFNQFHDIIGGSGLLEVHQDAFRDYDKLRTISKRIFNSTITSLLSLEKGKNENISSDKVLYAIFNPLSWNRSGMVKIPLQFDHNLGISSGFSIQSTSQNNLAYQSVQEEKASYLLVEIPEIPAVGYTTITIEPVKVNNYECDNKDIKILNENQMLEITTPHFRLKLNKQTGNLDSIYDFELQRELLQNGGNGNGLISLDDFGDSEGFLKKGDPNMGHLTSVPQLIIGNIDKDSIQVVEHGPLRAIISIKKTFQNSMFLQEIICFRNLHQIDFKTTLDWHDVQQMIKVQFPIQIENPLVTYDSAYGTIERAADGNEYPAQKWVDLGTAEFGVALLNYARYAHDVKDSNLRLTLLRSPIEQVRSTDEGRHVIEYSLIPHKGSWQDASIMQKGYEFNVRPDIISLSEYLTPDVQLKKTSTSYFSVSTPNVMIEAIKLAYDAQNHFSIILRFFEFHGEQNPVEIISLFSVQSVTETDLLERPINSKNPIKLVNNHRIIVGFSPYEIKTLKLTIEK